MSIEGCGCVAPSLVGATQAELAETLGSATRARAVARWLFGGSALPTALPERIEGVSPSAWAALRARYRLDPLLVAGAPLASSDGTLKWRVSPGDGVCETVLIPGRGRSTVCISSQLGCTRRCAFCATARLGYARTLDPAERVAQVYLAKAHAPPDAPLRNIVFMGMGEPLDDVDATLRTLALLTQAPAPGFAPAHLTVSTAGALPGMTRFLEESRVHLALSLNATTDASRERLMPHNRLWPIGALMEALRRHAARAPGRLYFIEYVLLDGINDSDDDARRLTALLQGLPARVNLIPFNPFEGCEFRPSPPEQVRRFFALLHAAKIRCLVRSPRGETIAAACGQLAARAER